ncbi:hypothetical protein MPOCJGCO_2432 [Methylobacterium trifolii]|uniref:Uncharacterized protein n=1 Tax=Methylobacterium trifolii TaxID=1003092 RepID=A0ABQ4U0L4_9HYPH|nr:hypothetical protein MPOCJGCO_2432 [Methylobacterium trifolii]
MQPPHHAALRAHGTLALLRMGDACGNGGATMGQAPLRRSGDSG